MSDVDDAVDALRRGGAVVLPTDTVYGLAALDEAVLLELKGRPESVPIAVLVADAAQAESVGRFDDRARRLAVAFWPGPLTIVVPSTSATTAPGPTIGIRCPDHELVRQIAARIGPLPTTSANRHGEPTPPTAAEAAASLTAPPALVVDGGELRGAASTVVDTTGPEVRILREGDVPGAAVLAVLS